MRLPRPVLNSVGTAITMEDLFNHRTAAEVDSDLRKGAKMPSERFSWLAMALVSAILSSVAHAAPQLGWDSSTANLSVARSLPAGTSVGYEAFFAGGYPFSKVVDIYDASTQTWHTAQLSQARTEVAATALGSLAIFAGGSYSYGASRSAVVDILDASTGVWTTASLSEARASVAAVSGGNESVFAGGWTGYGSASHTVDIYNSSTGHWTVDHLPNLAGNVAGTFNRGKFFFAGGSASNLAQLDVFDLQTHTWSSAMLSVARTDIAAVTLGSKVLFAGGWAGYGVSDVVDIYDFDSDTWTTSHLSTRRSQLAATVLGNKVLFAGGYAGSGLYSAVVDVYDGDTGEWSTLTLSQARTYMGAAGVGESALFAGGLLTGGTDVTDRVDIFTVPEPGTVVFLALGACLLASRKRSLGRVTRAVRLWGPGGGKAVAFLFCVWMVLPAGQAEALPVRYTLTDLGEGNPSAINNNGQIVGMKFWGGIFWYDRRAFLWQDGTFVNLGGYASWAEAINSAGAAVGYQMPALGPTRAMLWVDGNMIDLNIRGPYEDARARGINDSGVIVGSVRSNLTAFRLDGTTYSEYPDSSVPSCAYDINSSGQIVGYLIAYGYLRRAFLWEDDSATMLASLGGDTEAHAINDSGLIVGHSVQTGLWKAVYWDQGGLHVLPSPPGKDAAATAVNAAGQIVGTVFQGDSEWKPYLWEDGVAYDLTTLIPPTSEYRWNGAAGINDRGQIVANALHLPTGETHVLLFEPVPEPATLALLAVGGLGVIGRAVRRRRARQAVPVGPLARHPRD